MLRADSNFLTGMDSYYFANNVFEKSDDLSETPVLGKFIFNHIPQNINLIRCIMLMTTTLVVVIFGLVGELINKKYGWTTGLLLLTGIFFKVIFVRLEDDLFGLVFVMLAFYFIMRYNKSIKNNEQNYYNNFRNIKFFDRNIILSLVFLLMAVLIWKWAIYFLLLFLLISRFHIAYVVPSALALLLYFKNIIHGMLPSLMISENMPAIGVIAIAFMFISYFKSYRVKSLDLALVFATVLTMMNLKFTFLLYPLLCLNFINGISKTESLIEKRCIFVIILLFFVGMSLINYTALPGEDLNNAIDKIMSYKEQGIDVDASWGIGYYWIWYTDQDTNNYGHPQFDYKGKYILTVPEDPSALNCPEVDQLGKYEIVDCRNLLENSMP